MRDVIIFAVIFSALPFMLWRPSIGVLFWMWFGLMNPHRLAWGFAYAFPFAQWIAGATLLGMLFTKEPRQMKGGAAAGFLLAFVAWTCVTTLFALVPDRALFMLDRTLKIQLFVFLALLAFHKRQHVIATIWICALSIGYYSIKGGLFTLATLGKYRVYGPEESFIADNNSMALATTIAIPLFAYLYTQYRHRLVRLGLAAAMALSAVSALGSHSRGALLAMIAMVAFLWLKSRRKLALGIVLVIAAVGMVAFMPTSWDERMQSIGDYQEDASAQGRINTWKMLTNLAMDRPIVGGGFEPYQRWIFEIYRPEYSGTHTAHSIYFQVMGEHGFVGLFLWGMFWILVWRAARQIIASSNGRPDRDWAFWLARMLQVSMVGYFVGGAFVNMAYWDFPYWIFVAIVITRWLLLQEERAEAPVPAPSPYARPPLLEGGRPAAT